MTEKTYRTKEETIELFKSYQKEYEKLAHEEKNHYILRPYYEGKAEAYETAAFELERNMK